LVAIAGPVSDRLQRQVAPTLEDWRLTEANSNWSRGQFLPNASTFTEPSASNLCGVDNVREGQSPVSTSAGSTCTSWIAGNVNDIVGNLTFLGCNQVAGNNYQCRFRNIGFGPLTARVNATAPSVGGSFRAPITGANVTNDRGGTVSNFFLSLATGNGQASLQFDMSFPLIAWLTVVTVTFPNLPDAAVLSDPRMQWFVNNQWGRYTYYVVARGAELGAGNPCSGPGDNDCLTLNGLAVPNNTDDKQLILALVGPRAVGLQSQPSNNRADYLESRSSGTVFDSARVTPTFNDRLAACPFSYPTQSGPALSVCN
jgi:hypothetical protein